MRETANNAELAQKSAPAIRSFVTSSSRARHYRERGTKGPGHRQRRRHHRRLRRPGRQLLRTLPSSHQRSAGSRGAPAARPVRSPPTAGTASPRPNGTWRRSESAPSPSRAKPRSQPPAAPSSIPAASASSSSGEPAAKAGSATSNADTAGTAPGWTAATEPPSGAGTGYSPTTWSRSAPSPADLPRPDPRTPPVPPPEISLQTFSGRSKLGRGLCPGLPSGIMRSCR